MHLDASHPGHGRSPSMRLRDRRRVLIALLVTSGMLVVELIGGFLSHSLALQSDAGHLLTDVGALALTGLALLMAERPSDVRRTFGYHRLEIIAALGNGLVLLVLSIFLLIAAWGRLAAPVSVRADLVLLFGAVGLAANLFGMWLLHGSHSLNLRGAYLHLVSDALTSISVLLGGAVMHLYPRLVWIDPLVSALIALAIVWSAFRLIREAVDILLETTPSGVDLERLVEEIRAVDGVLEVHDLHCWTITSGMVALSAHIVVGEKALGTRDALLTEVKQRIQQRYHIAHSTLQLESVDYEHTSELHGDPICEGPRC